MTELRGEPTTGRSGVVAALLGALVPGLGHAYIRRWSGALLMAAPLVVVAAAVVAVGRMPKVEIVGLLVTPSFLRAMLAVNVLALVWRVAATVDPYRLVAKGGRSWNSTTVVLIALMVALPHLVVARYTLDAANTLETVFVTGEFTPIVVLDEPPALTPTAEPVEVFEVSDPAVVSQARHGNNRKGSIFRDKFGDPEAVALPPIGAYWQRKGLAELLGTDYDGLNRLTILLVGGDGGPGRSGNRTDSIIVATLDKETGKSAVFGIPRNMTHVPLPERWSTAFVELEQQLTPWQIRREWTDEDGDGEPDQFVPCHCFPDQINAIYPFTRKWVDTYPDEVDPGLAALRDTLEIMLGIEIDYYAMVDMSGFVRVVNALGGVRTYVTSPVQTDVSPAEEGGEWIEIDLSPGWNRLNGHEALAYVRERHSSSDYARMKRQRCMLKAVAAQADPFTIVTRFSQISRAIRSAVRTDIPVELLPSLLKHGASLDFNDIATIGFVPPYYTPVVDDRGKPTPDLLRIQAMVRWALNAEADTEFATGRESECRV